MSPVNKKFPTRTKEAAHNKIIPDILSPTTAYLKERFPRMALPTSQRELVKYSTRQQSRQQKNNQRVLFSPISYSDVTVENNDDGDEELVLLSPTTAYLNEKILKVTKNPESTNNKISQKVGLSNSDISSDTPSSLLSAGKENEDVGLGLLSPTTAYLNERLTPEVNKNTGRTYRKMNLLADTTLSLLSTGNEDDATESAALSPTTAYLNEKYPNVNKNSDRTSNKVNQSQRRTSSYSFLDTTLSLQTTGKEGDEATSAMLSPTSAYLNE
jgi:hypothetical protein